MKNKRVIIDIVDVDKKPLQLAVIYPTNRINQDANMAYNLKMATLIRIGSQNPSNRLLLRSELEQFLLKMGIWTLDDSLEVEKLFMEIRARELMLKKGGLKISEGRALALEMAEKRQLVMERYAHRQQFDSATVESHAENYRFEILLVNCLVCVDNDKPFIRDHNQYIARQDEESIIEGAKVLAKMVYGLESNIHNHMFEMKWLKDAGMIDDDGKYISKDGVHIDRDGRLIDKNGRYIDADGKIVDTFGREVDKHGNLLVNISKPFIDDETGKEIIIGDIGLDIKKKKKRKKRVKKTLKKTSEEKD